MLPTADMDLQVERSKLAQLNWSYVCIFSRYIILFLYMLKNNLHELQDFLKIVNILTIFILCK